MRTRVIFVTRSCRGLQVAGVGSTPERVPQRRDERNAVAVGSRRPPGDGVRARQRGILISGILSKRRPGGAPSKDLSLFLSSHALRAEIARDPSTPLRFAQDDTLIKSLTRRGTTPSPGGRRLPIDPPPTADKPAPAPSPDRASRTPSSRETDSDPTATPPAPSASTGSWSQGRSSHSAGNENSASAA
jgi:hypothetical protein